MSLSDIIITYHPCYFKLSLDNQEWKNMINNFLIELPKTTIGLHFIEKIKYYLAMNYKIEITNMDLTSRTIYPKTKYINSQYVLIVIPSIPYFTKVECVTKNIFEQIRNYNSPFEDLIKISEFRIPKKKLKKNDIDNFIVYEEQSYFITLIHELIHCIRFFENIHDDIFEEYATIYGLDGKTLRCGDYYITENAFRKVYGKNPRISHDSVNIYIHNIRETYANENHFSKQSFTKI